jgi:TM2 domain-containing membrane protein YozV
MSASSERPSDRERGPGEAFCRDCGAIISDRAEICPECGVRQRPPPQSTLDSAVDDLVNGGNPFVAAVLSALVPGVGQFYNRELEKGLVLLVAGVVAAFSTIVLVGFVLYPAVVLYAIYDAYTVAEAQSAAVATGGGVPDAPDAARDSHRD